MKTFIMLSDVAVPIDCQALLQFIQAAQSLYTENCPIAQPTMRQAKKKPVNK